MNLLRRFSLAAAGLALLAPATMADGRNPGSVLVYPVHRSLTGGSSNPTAFFTVVTVTNTNLSPIDGSTNVKFDYVNTTYNPDNPFEPLSCSVVDVVEPLTPADTLSVLTSCHNAAGGQEGYVVVSAQDPSKFKTDWSFNHLIGSEAVVTSDGGYFSFNAFAFTSPVAAGGETDIDVDGELDFDGVEYEGVADELYFSFVSLTRASMCMINLTGGTDFNATIKFDAFNDNEMPLSATKTFRCWYEQRLEDVALIFSKDFLENLPSDPTELDTDCDGVANFETGWSRVTGVVANSSQASIPDPALLGCISAGPNRLFDGGRLMWESEAKQFNGDFLHFGGSPPN